MNVIDKYLTEAKLNVNDGDIKKMIGIKKSAIFDVQGKTVTVISTPGTTVLKYPSDMVDFTYKLAQISDELGYDTQQIGIDTKKTMKFIIDKD